MWDRTRVKRFLSEHPIETEGSLRGDIRTPSQFCLEEKDDGDVWYRVTVPWLGQNDTAMCCLINFLQDALMEGDTKMYPIVGQGGPAVLVSFYSHYCDPS